MNKYERKNHSNYKYDAQLNLEGRTHYVDDGTLRWHKARIVRTQAHDNGLLFSLIESVALDMNNTKRGFRYVIFDLFGNVISRPDLENTFKTSEQAKKAMYEVLNAIDAKAVNLEGLENHKRNTERENARTLAMIEECASMLV